VLKVREDLRTRYDLDEEDVRALGARLADQDHAERHDENASDCLPRGIARLTASVLSAGDFE
jgi:hypothetical protein